MEKKKVTKVFFLMLIMRGGEKEREKGRMGGGSAGSLINLGKTTRTPSWEGVNTKSLFFFFSFPK